MAKIYKTTFQLRRGLASAWQGNNPVLARGEPGFEIDTNRLKIGDGSTDWNGLKYIDEEAVFNAHDRLGFPSIGKDHIIYKAESEQKLYQWNSQKLRYEVISDGTSALDIDLIHGGNAEGIGS